MNGYGRDQFPSILAVLLERIKRWFNRWRQRELFGGVQQQGQGQWGAGQRSHWGITPGFAISCVLILSRAFGFASSASISAQVDHVNCTFFETEEDVQATLDEKPALAITLDGDGDGNGIARETLPKQKDGGSSSNGKASRTVGPPNTGVGSAAEDSIPLWILPVAALTFAVGGVLILRPHRMSDTRA